MQKPSIRIANKTILLAVALLLMALPWRAPLAYSGEALYSQIADSNSRSLSGHTSIDQIIGRKIVDQTNRVIGEVADIRLARRGIVVSYIANINGLSSGNGKYAFHSRMLKKPAQGAFSVSVHRNDLGGFINAIEPAGGDSNTFSARSLLGAKVKGFDGQRLGTVQSVLLNNSGTRVFALMVRGGRGKVGNFILPVNDGLSSTGNEIFLDQAYTQALLRFLSR